MRRDGRGADVNPWYFTYILKNIALKKKKRERQRKGNAWKAPKNQFLMDGEGVGEDGEGREGYLGANPTCRSVGGEDRFRVLELCRRWEMQPRVMFKQPARSEGAWHPPSR